MSKSRTNGFRFGLINIITTRLDFDVVWRITNEQHIFKVNVYADLLPWWDFEPIVELLEVHGMSGLLPYLPIPLLDLHGMGH